MNYNALLDFYFSHPVLSYGLPFVAFGAVVFVRGSRKKKQKSRSFIWPLYYVLPVFFLMVAGIINPEFLGYGNPAGIKEVRYINGKLYVVDYIMSMGSRASSGSAFKRVHILDPATGKKERRFLIGFGASLNGVRNDTLIVAAPSEVKLFSTKTGKKILTYDKKTLPKLFPELAIGIDNFMWGDGRNIMELTALDGKNWNLHTLTGKLILASADRDTFIPSKKLYVKERYIKYDDERFGSDYLELDSKQGGNYTYQLYNKNDSLLYPELSFISGQMAAINSKDSTFVVVHYETTKQERFILTCLAMDGSKQLWEIKQKDLNKKFVFKYKQEVHIDHDEISGLLFFNIAGEIFALNMMDGKLVWRRKL